MVKTRGLPPTFSLNVSQAALQGPVELGDYLDDDDPPRAPSRLRANGFIPPAPSRRMVPNVVNIQRGLHRSDGYTLEEPELQEEVAAPLQRPSKGAPRKQLNMNPETLRMVDELLHYLQVYSVQKDAKASEMFHALVAALYEARELLDFSEVQPRGRWGTPTARAFPILLKNAFQSAIAEWQRRRN